MQFNNPVDGHSPPLEDADFEALVHNKPPQHRLPGQTWQQVENGGIRTVGVGGIIGSRCSSGTVGGCAGGRTISCWAKAY